MLCPLEGRARDCVSPWAWHGTLCSTDTLVLTLLVRPGSRGDPYHFRGRDEVWGWEGQQCSQLAQVCILAATSHLRGPRASQPPSAHL